MPETSAGAAYRVPEGDVGLAQNMEGAALCLSAPPQPGPSRAPRALSPSLQ